MSPPINDFEQKLKAQEKTIRVLSERLEQQIADDISGFALFEQNIALENVVTTRTRELEAKRAELEQALAHLKAAQTELLQAQKLQAIGQLASGIAHEINTPIQYVGDNLSFLNDGFNELMLVVETCRRLAVSAPGEMSAQDYQNALTRVLEEADLDFLTEEIPKALRESREGVRRIAGIVGAMKDFAHPSGEIMQPVDLQSLIHNTIEITRNEWKLVADVQTHFDPQLPQVHGLKDQLGQVMLNLIVNAAHAIEDHQEKGQSRGVIRISTRGNGDWAEIQVEDNGCGIPATVREKIFEPFFTTKDVGRGSGQGLAIVYNVIADKHQGKLEVHSEPGKGAVFTISLPLTTPTTETNSPMGPA